MKIKIENISPTKLSIRRAEIRFLGRAGLVRALIDTFNGASPFLVAVCSFVAYTAVGGNVLTPQVAFVSLTLFNQLRFPMNVFALLMLVNPQ
jgi:hypothetical protein